MIHPKCLALITICFCFYRGVAGTKGENDWHYQAKESHPCQRPCVPGDVKTCYYRFSIEWYWALSKACYDCPQTLSDCYREDCVPADGIQRSIMVVNRQMPGPSVEVCYGDKVEVEVEKPDE
ncbi:uncharacterized protein LOC124367713 [Homalodisca vitripennis]|uniref:uncharacterized protein LOC124367713 n=1 Tax=Homalodisca vitripennis TaxID=197043 RepID=UPI001EEC9F04|nr:uncharacterized protein LOC124367713 [Homalodisca vitripennis]